MEDAAIVDMYLSRDEDAIARTSDKYGSRLRTISYGILRNNETAKECENDTYLQAWNRIPPSKPYEYLFHFLACLIRHVSLDIWRGQHRLMRSAHVVELTRELEQCIPSSDNPEDEVDKILLGQIINRYVSALPEEKRIIFLRRYWYMDPIAIIAEKLNIRESKVKTTLFRCRNELRIILEKEGYYL